MIKNYIVIAIRNIRRQKVSSLINILGLAIGITCSFLIFLYIQTELSFDKFYPNSENIYRLGCTNNMGGKIDSYCNAPRPTSPLMKTEFPEVIENTRVCGMNGLYTHKADFIYKRTDNIFGEIFRSRFYIFQCVPTRIYQRYSRRSFDSRKLGGSYRKLCQNYLRK